MASKLQCTYIFTGNVGVKQHYYHCLTCNINTNPQSGICEVCAKFCHSSHNLKYIGVGKNIVCECGNKGPRFCGRMTPQLFEAQAQDTCSYSKTKTNATFQHFYQCKTCNLVGQYGLCELCCKACHKGHEVVYAGFSAKFCIFFVTFFATHPLLSFSVSFVTVDPMENLANVCFHEI